MLKLSVALSRLATTFLLCISAFLLCRDRPRRSTATMVNDPFTHVIALDKSGYAVGDLYIDDGRSFAFAEGQYLHRRWVPVEVLIVARNIVDMRLPPSRR